MVKIIFFSRKLLDLRRNRKTQVVVPRPSLCCLLPEWDLGRRDGRLDSSSEFWCCGGDSRQREQADG